MKFLKTISNKLLFILEFLKDLIIPENKKIRAILKIERGNLRLLLPRSPIKSDSIFVLFDYKNETIRLLVKALKYKNNHSVKRIFAEYLYEDMLDIFSDISLFEGQAPLLVPMPMSKMEKKNRGWSQCEELCKEIQNVSSGSIKTEYKALLKTKETARQTKLGKKERLLNVKDSMIADPKLVKGKVVAIVDDVYTTGATMDEARRALYASGAKRVINFFLAH